MISLAHARSGYETRLLTSVRDERTRRFLVSNDGYEILAATVPLTNEAIEGKLRRSM